LVSDDNRAVLARSGRLFCLDASAEEIARRVGGDALRPLLGAPESTSSPVERIASLLKQREAAYALIPHHAATDGLTPEQVAQRVLACAQQSVSVDMQRSVRAGNETYDVILGAGVWQQLGARLRERLPQSPSAAIVSDETVGPLYAPAIAASLR